MISLITSCSIYSIPKGIEVYPHLLKKECEKKFRCVSKSSQRLSGSRTMTENDEIYYDSGNEILFILTCKFIPYCHGHAVNISALSILL